MPFHEELRDIDDAKLRLSLLNVIKADEEGGDSLVPPSDDYSALMRMGDIAAKFFMGRAKEIQAEADEAGAAGREINKEKLARAIGRLEGMGAGFTYAIDVIMNYAEAERLDKETGLG